MYDVYRRYAVSWVPEWGDPIAGFGRRWSGWCAEEGMLADRRPIGEIGSMVDGLASEIGRQGLQGVVVAPFCLRRPRDAWRLESALEHLAATTAPIALAALKAAIVADRVTLIPAAPNRALEKFWGLANAALSDIAAERPHAGRDDLASLFMRPMNVGFANLSADRFHLPLTDRLEPFRAQRVARSLARFLVRSEIGPATIADIALIGDPGGGRRARVLHRMALTGPGLAPASGPLEALGPRTLHDGVA